MPLWLEAPDVVFFHRELIIEHGGLPGIRNMGALESVLARPRQRLNYQPDATICELAAAYGYGFARNHVFADGNKRVALAVLNVFLLLNGLVLTAEEAEAVVVINDLAAGQLDERELAAWITARSSPFDLDAE